MAKTTAKKKSKLTPLEQQIAELKALLPAQQDWRTTDAQEIARRQVRALENPPAIRNLNPSEEIHSVFEVPSPDSQRTYRVEILDLSQHLFHSSSPDFAINGLGTCKHTEAVLFHLKKRFPELYQKAEKSGPATASLIIKNDDLFLHNPAHKDFTLPRKFRLCITVNGERKADCPPEKLIHSAEESDPRLIYISQQVASWHQEQSYKKERLQLAREYQQKVHSGDFPQHETLLPLFPYQREGMLHLAFKERAMVADEMGLGKTIQGIAAAALLHRMGKATRCLIVAPASLKAEWEEQIHKFTKLPCEVVYGNRSRRAHIYQNPGAFFTVVNYEQVRSDSLDINAALQPDIVILDEAQRIKNWTSLTAQAIKRLHSRYAFVLTGTPIENRIDELYSIVEFLDPRILGSLFRFNRDHYILDEEKGKPEGYKNLAQLREKIKPILLRRRKADVETELPDRSDENRYVLLTEGQLSDYSAHQEIVKILAHKAKKRPLRKEEFLRLMGAMGCMRMLCDTQFILDKETRDSPKLDELIAIFDEALEDPDTKIIVFSEWTGMLGLIRDHLKSQKIGYAWHTGSVDQKKRRVEIKAFKEDPDCRLFLCTESGGSGLNLQNASIVINVDLPWNPAKLEQRIARAWRKGQTRPVKVINLIAQGTIEHGMLETLAMKQGLADGVLDGKGNLSEIQLKKGGQSFLARLEQTLETGKRLATTSQTHSSAAPADPGLTLAQKIQKNLGDSLLHCEEHFIGEGGISKLYLVVKSLSPGIQKHLLTACDHCYPDHKDVPNWLEENIVLIDQATHNSFLQLQRAGLMQSNTRARRNLLASDEKTATKATLTPEQRAQIKAHQSTLAEQNKAATALLAADLPHLATPHLKAALLATAQITAIENFTTPAEKFAQLHEPAHHSFLPPAAHPFLEKADTLTKQDARNLAEILAKGLSPHESIKYP